MSFKGSTQSLNDSTKVPDVHLKKVLKAARLSNLYKEESNSKQREINLLESRISNKDSIIEKTEERVELNKNAYEKMQGIYNIERAKNIDLSNSFNNYKNLKEKEIKKLNRQKTTKSISGIIVGAAIGILVGILIN